MNELAPIVVFVYNRPDCARRMFEALRKCTMAKDSELFIYSDAPKDDRSVDLVRAVRKVIISFDGFKKITIIERDKNLGLADSIITGVTEIIDKYGKAIVVEDDLIVGPHFLIYMNEVLRKYEDNIQVMSVTAYSFANKFSKNLDDTYFLPITSSWAWGTWKDRWMQFDINAKGWEILKNNRKLRQKFNFCKATSYYSMMKKQMEEKTIDSWAIRWYWTVFQRNGLTVYPKETIVNNEGYEGNGVHCYGANDAYTIFGSDRKLKLTDDIKVSRQACRIVKVNLWYRKLRQFLFGLQNFFKNK